MGISAGNNSTNQPVSSEIWGAPDLHKDADYSNFVELKSDGAFRLVVATRYGRKVMLKSVKQEYADDLLCHELLQKEFEILMKLDNNSIVRVHNIEDVPGLGKCIVMEYVDGDTLDKFISGNNPNKKSKLHLLTELIQTIDYLHSKQIVHRDLKPTNIMVLKGGEHLKLIDFGLADSSSYELLKQPAGTSGYSSPEQQTEWTENPRNDIYSIGKIMEDMHLGSRYNTIIKTCIGDIQNRPSAKELLSMIGKVPLQNKMLAIAACFIGIVVIGIVITLQLTSNQETPISPSVQQKIATPLKNDTTVVPSNKDVTIVSSSNDKTTSAPVSSVSVPTDKAGNTSENIKAYQPYLDKGKKIIDKDAKLMDYMVDTLSSVRYFSRSPIDYALNTEEDKIIAYTKQFKEKLTKEDYDALVHELINYYRSKTDRWMDKLADLNGKL